MATVNASQVDFNAFLRPDNNLSEILDTAAAKANLGIVDGVDGSLNDLSDVAATPSTDDILVFDGTNWVSTPPAEALGEPEIFNPGGAVSSDNFTLSSSNSVALVTLNGLVLKLSEYSLAGSTLTVTPDLGFDSSFDEVMVFQNTGSSSGGGASSSSSLPTGGDSGQILTKISDVDGETNWTTPSLVLLEEVFVAADTLTVTFENIPPDFQDLKIVTRFRGDISPEMRFGSGGVIDTGSNYNRIALQDGTTENQLVSEAQSVLTDIWGYAVTPNGADPAGYFGAGEITIYDYANPRGYAIVAQGQGGGIRTSSTGRSGNTFFQWNQTDDPLDTIVIGGIVSAGSIIAGTIIKLYGVGNGARVSTTVGGDVVNLTDASSYESWPNILRNTDNGDLVVTFNDGPQHAPGSSSRVVKQIISTDDGATWGSESTIINTSDDDSVFGVGLDSSANLLAWSRRRNDGGYTTLGHDLYVSTDDGATWSVLSSPTFSPMPVVIQNIISVPTVGLLCGWHSDSGSNSWGILTSDDDGATWTQTTVESGLSTSAWPVESNFAYIGAGRIIGIGRTQITSGSGRLFQLESDDYGATWTRADTNISTYYTRAAIVYDASGDLLNMFYFARGEGRLYYVQVDPDTVWGSPTSWPAGTVIASGSTSTSDAGYADAVTEGDGSSTAHVVWYDKATGVSKTRIKYIPYAI